MEEWYVEWLRYAYKVALNSPDTSTQNGGVALDFFGNKLGEGCNTFTRGMEVTPDLLERPKKYAYIEHAERNTLFDCFAGTGEVPYYLVVAWAACADCARAIVQCGVHTLIRHDRADETNRWNQSIEDGDAILQASGIEIINYTGALGDCEPVLFAGELWTP